MGKLSLSELLKASAAFAGVSALTTEAGLLLLDRVADVDIPGAWYLNAPLAAWLAVGIPTSINLAGRLLSQADSSPGRIWGFQEGALSPIVRRIPFAANGQQGAIYAHTAKTIFGETLPAEEEGPAYRPAVWRVPLRETVVSVRESELRAFLEAAWKRPKHQFSRRYWTQRRRPPLWRAKYDALMRLLVEAGLVEGRHSEGRASGRLVVFPREAVWYLKYESQFRVTPA